MTTAVHQKPPKTAPKTTATPYAITYQGSINMDLIDVHPQVRKTFEKTSLAELTASIKTKGVINPVTLRRSGDRFELVAGERRFRAARAAGLTTIPATVRDLDDQSAALYQVEENIHRKDLTLIEEARGFKLLLDARKFDVAGLSNLVDKSVPYVYRAIRLLELPDNVLDLIESGKLTPAHGHQILRVPVESRAALVDYATKLTWNDSYPTAKNLAERIGKGQLENAIFPKNKPYAGAAACTTCQYNTGNQEQLFDGAEKGGCTNSACFDTKTAMVWADKAAALKVRFPAASVTFTDNYLNVGYNVKGGTVKSELTDKTKRLGAEQSLVIAKGEGGKVYIVEKVSAEEKAKSSSGAAKSDPRQEFIDAAVQLELAKCLADASVKLTKKHLVLLLENTMNEGSVEEEQVEKALGFGIAEPSSLSETQLSQALTLVCAVDWQGKVQENFLTDLKLNVNTITKVATAAASKEYDAQQTKRPA